MVPFPDDMENLAREADNHTTKLPAFNRMVGIKRWSESATSLFPVSVSNYQFLKLS